MNNQEVKLLWFDSPLRLEKAINELIRAGWYIESIQYTVHGLTHYALCTIHKIEVVA